MRKYIVIIILCVVSFVLGKYSTSNQMAQSEQVVINENIQSDITKTDVGEITETETRHNDGSVQIQRKITYNKTENNQTDTIRSVKIDTQVQIKNIPEHQITIMYNLSDDQSYTFMYQKRIFSSLYVGGFGQFSSNPEYGLSISLGF